jgi:hypothetical protein
MNGSPTERGDSTCVTRCPAVVIGVVTVHVLVTLSLIAIIFYLLWLTRSPEILEDKDSADAIHGLKIGATVLAIPVVFWLPGLYGMRKRKLWGWWLTLVTGLGMASVFVYSMIDDGWHSLNAEDAAITATFAVLPLLLLLPQVRKYYRKPQADPPAAIDTVQRIPHTTS